VSEYARPEMLVDGAWLQAHLDDPAIRVVDCDSIDAYRRAHIPGAVASADNRYKDPDNPRFVMQPQQFAEAMASLGIGNDTTVVAYDASGTLNAGRLWWCLAYFGHTNTKILDGGWHQWLADGRPVTTDMAKVEREQFTPRPDESLRASAEYVVEALHRPDAIVLDVRSDGEWQGTNNRGNRRAGHMPEAVHIEWTKNLRTEEARRIKPAAELRAMFEAQGVTPDKEVITVCQGGIRAAQAAATLHLLGYEKVRNYDGSFADWGNREDTPLV
jgi:thiosulfate/3-mercaptopyruvate sulfurtransferase